MNMVFHTRNQHGAASWAKVMWLFVSFIGLSVGALWTSSSSASTLAKFADAESPSLRVLFIGNSFVYYHDMPAIFVNMFNHQKPDAQLKVFASIAGGYKLRQHAKDKVTRKAITGNGPWDVIVLQEQSQMPLKASHAKVMSESLRRLDKLIGKNHARTALLMTWCDLHTPKDQIAISKVHRDAGRELNAIVIPAGELMVEVTRKEPEISLYDPDGHHPSLYGSYLVACLLCNMLGHANSESVNFSTAGVPDSIARKLEKYADDFADLELGKTRAS